MWKNRNINVSLVFVLLSLGAFVEGSTVDISPVNSPAGLELSGQVIYAINLGNNGNPTFGDFVFSQDQDYPEVICSVSAEGVCTTWGVPYPNTGYPELDKLLGGLVWTNSNPPYHNTTSISVGGLVVGVSYQLQLVFYTQCNRLMDIAVEGATIAEYNPYPIQMSVVPPGGSIVKYVFTAGDDTLNIDIANIGGVGNASAISAFIVTQVVPPTPDFNGDRIVNFKDFARLASYWDQNETSVDIAPAPFGDGRVDGQDMAVFAEYWLFRTPDPATNPDPANGSAVAPLISDSNVCVMLDYTPGEHAVKHTGYFSDYIDDVNNRIEDANLGSPPWPAESTTAFHVGLDHPDIPAFARLPLIRGKTYYWCVDEFDGLFTWPGQVWSFLVKPIEAWGPDPVDGETNVPTNPNLTLSWNLGDLDAEGHSVYYIVYLGTDETAVTNADTASPEYIDTVEPTNYDVSGLDPSTTYYWRIDTKRRLNSPPFTFIITPGNIWSFTTGP